MLAAAPRLDCSPVVLAREQPFSIGRAEFRPATREVVFAGQSAVIEPRVMQLLVALRRAGGGLISKVDLADLVWDGRIVGDDSIHRVVSRLRSVAEEQAGGQFGVETVKKVGYRLVLPDGTSSQPSVRGRSLLVRREMIIGGAAAVLAGAADVGWFALRRDRTPAAAPLLVDNARRSLRQGDLSDTDNAIGMLREATRLAPDKAEAWGLLGFALMVAALDAVGQTRSDLRTRGFAAINRALALEPNQVDALAARIRAKPMSGHWFKYEQACRAALRLHADHPELIIEFATMLAEVGRNAEALACYEKARSLVSLSSELLEGRVFLLQSLGRLDEADTAAQEAFELLPRNYRVWNARAYYFLFSGRAGQALDMFQNEETRPAFNRQDEEYALDIAQAEAIVSGDPARIRKALDFMLDFARVGKGGVLATAVFAAFVGEVDVAFNVLNGLYFRRGFQLPEEYYQRLDSAAGDPQTAYLFTRPMASVRRDSRFAALTREIGLDDYWRRTKSRSRVTI